MNERSPYLIWALWFVAGGVAGAGISLLLAPQSGKATRQMMANTVRGTADSVRELKDRVASRGEEIWEEASLRAGDAVAALSGAAERKAGKRNEAHPA